ncbi:MAG: glutathione S-transferase family protein [Porticoccaceae bacterium]
MIKLYGLSVSNYYAMVKVFMLEKGFDFEEVYIKPTYSEPFLELSPMGKIPCIEVDEGYLSETTAIMGFLESCIPELPMTNEDSFRRAQMAQLIKVVELYIAVEYARLLDYVYFGAELNQAVADDARPNMVKGLAAFQRLCSFSPYLLGEEVTMADFFAYYIFKNAIPVAKKVWDWDIVGEVDGLADWLRLMSERPLVQQVDNERQAAITAFMENSE